MTQKKLWPEFCFDPKNFFDPKNVFDPKNFFDPKLTQPKLFQTKRTRWSACLPSFCELVSKLSGPSSFFLLSWITMDLLKSIYVCILILFASSLKFFLTLFRCAPMCCEMFACAVKCFHVEWSHVLWNIPKKAVQLRCLLETVVTIHFCPTFWSCFACWYLNLDFKAINGKTGKYHPLH